MTKGLSEKQKRFADFYIELGNASEAARKAGYSPKTAFRVGQENLQKPAIKSHIDERLKQLEDERIASASEVMKYLTAVLRNELTEEVIVVEGQGDGVSEARKIRKDISIKDRNKAAEMLAKRFGILTDKLQIEEITPIIIGGADELED